MSFDTDRIGHEKVCYVCDKPTQSHPVPNGWVCHTCKRNTDQTVLKDALDIPPRPELTLESSIPCWWCEQTHSLTDAIPSKEGILIGTGFPLLEDHTGFLIASCPDCLKSSDYLTTAECAERIADQVGVPVREYHYRHGWVER
jgi:hypothetical protein